MKFIFFLFLLLNYFSANSFEIEKISQFSNSEKYAQDYYRMQEENNIFYNINLRSLQIFDIENEGISLITDFDLIGKLRNITVHNDYAYISFFRNNFYLYRLDVSDVINPVITDTLFYRSYRHFNDGDYCIVNEMLSDWRYKIHIYDNNSFEQITEYYSPQEYSSLNSAGIGIGFTVDKIEPNIFTIYLYDLSNPVNLELLGSGSFTANTISQPRVIIYQDSILFFCEPWNGLKIFDISEPDNWEMIGSINNSGEFMISNVYLVNNYLVLMGSKEIRLYDLNDLSNLILLDNITTLYNNSYKSMYQVNNSVYLQTNNGGLEYYSIANNSFMYQGSFINYGCLQSAYLYNDNLYIRTMLDGVSCWDISDLLEPIYQDSYYEDYISGYYSSADGNILTNWGIDHNSPVQVNIVSQIESNGTLSELTRLTSPSFAGVLFYNEINGYFIVNNQNLKKYQLNEENELEEIVNLPIPGILQGDFHFLGNVAYLLSPEKLTVINNIDSNNEIEIANQLDTDFSGIQTGIFYQDYFFLSEEGSDFNTIIYDVSDPIYPEELFTLNNIGLLSIDEENELLFVGNTECTIYDLVHIEYDLIYEIYSFQNWSQCEQIIHFNRDDNDYLVFLEDTSANIYQYNTDNEVIENYEISFDFSLLNYPNPVKTENGFTTIKYQIPTSCQVELSVYNVKGQLIKRIINEYQKKGYHNIEWDGKDNYEKKVSSGQYFITLNVNNETKAIRKMILLR